MRRLRPVPLTTRPRVSVVIPCYNYGRYLPDAVSSALDQSGVDVDVLIVDDCSTDDSAAVAQRLAAADPRVDVLLHETNRGHIQTYNDGLEKVTGDYAVLLSADDVLTRDSLTRATALMEADPEVGMAYGAVRTFESHPPTEPVGDATAWAVWSGRDWAARLFERGRNALYSPEAVVRTDILRSVGLYDIDQPHAGDMQMWLRIAAIADIGFVAGATQAYYREHATNMHSSVWGTTLDWGMVNDLRHRISAFQTVSALYDDGDRLLARARRAEAVEAIDLASRAYVWGLTARWPIDELVAFARECEPAIDATVAGRAFRRRQRLGPVLSRRNPALVLRERLLARADRADARSCLSVGLPR